MNIFQKLWIKCFVKKNCISFDLATIFLNGNYEDEINWELIRILKIFKKLNFKIALIESSISISYDKKITSVIDAFGIPVDHIRYTNFENKGEELLKLGVILHFNRLNSEERQIIQCGIKIINVFQDGFVGIE